MADITSTTSTTKKLPSKPSITATPSENSFNYSIKVPTADKDTSFTINYTETGNPNWAVAQVTTLEGVIKGTRGGHELTVNVVAHNADGDSVASDNITVTPAVPTTTSTTTPIPTTTTTSTEAPTTTTSTTQKVTTTSTSTKAPETTITTSKAPDTTTTTTVEAHSGFYATWVFMFNNKIVTAEYLRQDVQDPAVSKNPYNYLALTPKEYTEITGVQWDSAWNTL